MDWTARYEELRQQTRQPSDRSFSAGRSLAVLLQRGTVAWMRAGGDSATSSCLTARSPRPALTVPAASISPLCDQWAQLLVEMLLHHSQEARA